MTELPTRAECLTVLKEEGCEPNVIEHCLAVESLAMKVGEKCRAGVDLKLISAGALLHDVGRSVTHDIQHGVRGVEILERRGMDTRIVDIVRKHIGAGLTPEEARSLGFPDGDYIPVTLEEKIVAYSDNLIGNPGSPDAKITSAMFVQECIDKGLDVAADRARALHDELCKLCEVDLNGI